MPVDCPLCKSAVVTANASKLQGESLSPPVCITTMKDWIRNAPSICQPRWPASVGSLPPVGVSIVRGPVKVLVTHPLPAEMWDWLARRWQDPIFPANFPWFGSSDYWRGQVDMLVEQIEAMEEDPLVA